MIQHYEEITWDDTDIIACKQALEILLNSGVSPSELLESDSFGNLDVSAVIAENYTEPEIVF
jgi:hypothetical protein